MVRETRHLWVGNLPDNIREDRIREHFKRSVKVFSFQDPHFPSPFADFSGFCDRFIQ
jgi:RNA recognition motif-containing protein